MKAQSKEHKEKIRQAKLKDLTGKKFGRLLVIKQSDERTNAGKVKWECRCDCGNTHKVSGDCLTHGKSKSCGCFRREYKRTYAYDNREYAIWKHHYQSTIVKRSTKDGYETDIDFNTFRSLSESPCYYCGLPKSSFLVDRSKNSDFTIYYNGLDRIDSSKGYMLDNVVPCCKHCNIAKNTMSQKDFMGWVKRIYEFNFDILGGPIVR